MSSDSYKSELMQLLDGFLSTVKLIIVLCIVILLYRHFGATFRQMTQLSWPQSPKYNSNKMIPEDIAFSSEVLAKGVGMDIVKKNCLGCHNAQLIVQNRMSKERWQHTIRWMQRTQGLWELGADEPIVLEYLATYYSPDMEGRRKNITLTDDEWYLLSHNY